MKKKPAHPKPCATCGHQSLHGEVSGCVAPVSEVGERVRWCDCTEYVNPRDRRADRAEGVQRGADGAEAAATGHAMTYDPDDWREAADARLDVLINRGTDFTAEDITDVVGVAPSPNAIGALFRTSNFRSRAEQVSVVLASRPAARGRMLRVWRGKVQS